MKFGVYLPNQGPFADVRVLAALGAEAEVAGWDGVFIWDAMFPIFEHSSSVADGVGDSRNVADPFIALTAIAASTERIRLGALVSPVARLRPETIAQTSVTLDHFSGGRLILGVGLGNPDAQFRAFGGPTDLRTRAAMTDEFLDVLTLLWSGEPADHRGDHYTAVGVSMYPRPLQQPRIPVWVGADSRHHGPRRRAGRWDGFVPASDDWPDGVISVKEYEAMAGNLPQVRDGGEAFDVVVIGNAGATSPTPASLPAYAAAGVTWALVQALTIGEAEDRIRRGPPASSNT